MRADAVPSIVPGTSTVQRCVMPSTKLTDEESDVPDATSSVIAPPMSGWGDGVYVAVGVRVAVGVGVALDVNVGVGVFDGVGVFVCAAARAAHVRIAKARSTLFISIAFLYGVGV